MDNVATKRRQKLVTTVIIVAAALVFIMPQLFNKSLLLGTDYNFHFNRIYDAAMQIRHHNFNFMQSNYGFSQSGRIVNALYGPLGTYMLGGLLLLAGSWLRFQLLTGFLVALLAGTSMYLFAIRLGVRRNWSRMAAALYIFTSWIPMWSLNQSAAGIGMAMMPLVLLTGVRLLYMHPNWRSALALGLSMGALIQIHLMSAVLAVVALIPLAIVALLHQRDRRGPILANGILAAVIAILLSANFLAAFYNVTHGNQIVGTFGVIDMYSNSASLSFADSFQTMVGLIFSIGFVFAAIYALISKRMDTLLRTITLTGAAFLLLSLRIMPWDAFAKHVIGVKNLIQFPNRFLAVAIPLLLVGLLLIVQDLQIFNPKQDEAKRMAIALQTTVVILFAFQPLSLMMSKAVQWQNGNGVSNNAIHTAVHMKTTTGFSTKQIQAAFDSSNLSTPLHDYYNGVIDYLPLPNTGATGTYNAQTPQYEALAAQYEQQLAVPTRTSRFHKTVIAGGTLQTTFRSKRAQRVRLPVVLYTSSKLRLNGRVVTPKLNKLGMPTVKAKVGRNVVQLSYQEPTYLKLAIRGTVVAWLILGLAWLGLSVVDLRKRQTATDRMID
ncbi:hypothetical protein PQ472_06270 [Lacticaseibacillus pabuli]|uniref:Membrane protein YfhO n=1 Tax=Lacticaseibacillus pabuli TaxID=3025672 RepID=A0ABY7WMX4_9LACO|nr:hypothetical protein [Lacticaseibacillus sp. KACC 23028]WDF81540.1 hypothetical protein PQ472_06270 [Lacticaseibacillus sp. KACC 23028]